jgi:hypothetical protein
MICEYFILGGFTIGLAVTFVYCGVTGISPVSSTWTSRSAMLASLPPDPQGIVYELGAGWGSLAFPLAGRYPHKQVIAYELSPVPWLFMKLRWFLTRPRNLQILRRNFLKVDLSGAGLVVCYLHPGALAKLAPKLGKELKPETLIISNTFELPGWTPITVKELDDTMCPQVFIYEIGPVIQEISSMLPFV